ncbi:MAG: hypothetical protein LBQ51_00695 [Desulfovibrio sp.]|nr:hypothetical protein [Desulfovibrio sp.]
MITYPDKNLEYDENGEGLWGCNCGRGILDRTYYVGPTGECRVECGCGLCAPWGRDEKEACFHWNIIMAALCGPYSLVELIYRRMIRLAKEQGNDSAQVEHALKRHLKSYGEMNHQ